MACAINQLLDLVSIRGQLRKNRDNWWNVAVWECRLVLFFGWLDWVFKFIALLPVPEDVLDGLEVDLLICVVGQSLSNLFVQLPEQVVTIGEVVLWFPDC